MHFDHGSIHFRTSSQTGFFTNLVLDDGTHQRPLLPEKPLVVSPTKSTFVGHRELLSSRLQQSIDCLGHCGNVFRLAQQSIRASRARRRVIERGG